MRELGITVRTNRKSFGGDNEIGKPRDFPEQAQGERTSIERENGFRATMNPKRIKGVGEYEGLIVSTWRLR